MSLSKHQPELMYPIGNPSGEPVVVCYEYVNLAVLDMLIKSAAINHDDKLKLRAYRRLPHKGDRFKVEYTYSYYSHNESGRLFARRSVGLQSFMCELRALLAGEYYYDVDQCNSLPTMLQYLCKKYDIICPHLDEYVDARRKVLEREGLDKKKFLKALLKSKKVPKSAFIKSIHATVYHQLVPALKADPNWQSVWKHHETIRKESVKNNPDGSFIAKVAHTFENKILLCMKKFFEERGHSVDVLIFDGCMVRRDPTVQFDDSLLRECEAVILEKTGIPMKLAVKPMEVSEEFMERLNDDGDIESGEFEEDEKNDGVKITPIPETEKLTLSKAQGVLDRQRCRGLVRYLNNFLAKVTDEATVLFAYRESLTEPWNLRCKAATREAMLHWKVKFNGKDKCIFDLWNEHTDMLTFKHVVMKPQFVGDTPWKELNLFKGFKATLLDTYDESIIAPVRNHILKAICADEAYHAMYLEQWVASIVQFPYQKTGTAPVIYGQHGCGKNILFEWIGEMIIGDNHYLYLNNLDDLTGTFTAYVTGKLLIVGDEISFSGGFKTNSIIKSKITQSKQKLEKKNVDPISIDDFSNYVFLSNHDNAMKVEDTDRRFFVKETAKVYRGDHEYFAKLAKQLDANAANHYYTYLMKMDLSKFNVRNIPHTEEKESMKLWAMSPFDHFVEELLEGRIVNTPRTSRFVENGEPEVIPATYFEPGETYETTSNHLWDKFLQFVASRQAGTNTTNLSFPCFSRTLRKKVAIQDKHKGHAKGRGVEIVMKVERV